MEVRIQGRLLRFARLEADKFHYLEDPQTLVDCIEKVSGAH